MLYLLEYYHLFELRDTIFKRGELMQKEHTQAHVLLDEKGNLRQPGYAKRMVGIYHRDHIQASKLRIKEWDYYLICNDNYGVALTMADNAYMGMMSLSILDFKERKEHTKSLINLLPMGKLNFPSTSMSGEIHYTDKNCQFSFVTKDNERILHAQMKNFIDKKPITVDFILTDEPEESIVIATPFNKDKHFYYNQKINNMKAKGQVVFDNQTLTFNDIDSTATLDWGRGVWTYDNTWYWGSGSGYVDGKAFGFNIGYGFGDATHASENMLFYEGKAHKLEDVTFNIPHVDGHEDYMKPWTFTSSDSRFEMEFTPLLDRYAKTSVGIIFSLQHQVFGLFNGTAILDDGTKIKLHDYLGFAEKVWNKW